MRKDIIYLTLYLFTELFNYLLAYRVIFQAEVTKDKKRWAAGIGCIFIIHYVLMYVYGELVSNSFSAVTMAILPVCLLKKREVKNFIIYPFIVMGITNIIISFTYFWAIIFDISEALILQNPCLGLVCQCMPITMMLFAEGYRKFKKKSWIQIQLGWQQYVLFYIGILCTYLMISALQLLSKGDLSQRVINICGLAISVACIAFILLILWQGIVVYREIQYKERCEINEEYLELQAEHYRQLMAQDKKMSKFRHDMSSHINMLMYYCENEKYQLLEDYLFKVVKESAIHDVAVYTRNRSVDAVIAPLAQLAQEKNIVMEWKGILPEEIKVSIYDLCTILSNLLKNAIEACEKIPEGQERKIQTKVGSYNGQIYLTIRNTVANEVVITNQKLRTSKKDKENHGIGSQNVKEAVEKYDGIIVYEYENGWFIVSIGI